MLLVQTRAAGRFARFRCLTALRESPRKTGRPRLSRASSSGTLLPGFGRPLNFEPGTEDPDYVGGPFPNLLSTGYNTGNRLPMTTLREFTMLQLMNSITDKPDWHIKVNNPEIAKKWRDEALASDRDITPKMVDWCLDELRYKATFVLTSPANPPPIVVYNGDVVKSDTALSSEFKQALQQAVTKFEDSIPDNLRDWHPGSDEKVWDLVHPSLFPLVYGHTRVLENGETTTLEDCIERCGQGRITEVPPEAETVEIGAYLNAALWKPYSAKFQWLPCEVDISGEEAKITSYINNLHPATEKPLYGLIEKLISASIPLWDLSLAPLQYPWYHERRIEYTECIYDPDPEAGPERDGPQRITGEDEGDFDDRRQSWIEDTRQVVRPEPEMPFAPLRSPPDFSLRDEYRKRGLQVIVKLANIELTPEKPDYNGGSWHVEGKLNEHIVATSLYYYSCSNITPSSISFRQTFIDEDTVAISYPQDHYDWLTVVFGCEQDGPAIQDVGSVQTSEGRLLTFSNILQHRVGPFKLADPAKPGHRKIVALFLVDPNIKVISTAHVPCQRQDWWQEASQSARQKQDHASSSSTATTRQKQRSNVAEPPREGQDHILEDADFPISLHTAKALREELMEERREFVVNQGAALEIEVETISLCEH
ncbi:hypothetical protein BDZ97DRAFT_2077483 [Flammula alnicola]|nr:hypothetical protein BDZ97DRAFT_2077483 [Flammula alnicola]